MFVLEDSIVLQKYKKELLSSFYALLTPHRLESKVIRITSLIKLDITATLIYFFGCSMIERVKNRTWALSCGVKGARRKPLDHCT